MKDLLSLDPEALYKEMQANYLASAILMPKELTLMIWGICRSVDEVADVFNVPLDVAAFRLSALGVID